LPQYDSREEEKGQELKDDNDDTDEPNFDKPEESENI
jgi:hypothetical protein